MTALIAVVTFLLAQADGGVAPPETDVSLEALLQAEEKLLDSVAVPEDQPGDARRLHAEPRGQRRPR